MVSKFDRDLKSLIQILIRNNVPAIYPAEIAHLLHCEIERVDQVLFRMTEEELLEHSFELHCGECGEVMAVFEDHKELTSASFPCDACNTQMESITMNETVSAFYPQGCLRIL